MKSLILIFIALGCGLVASIGISQVMNRDTSGGLEMEQILVALADIDIGTKLDAQNVKLEDWPKAKIPDGAVRRLEDVKGKFANVRFFKGEPLHINKISDQLKNIAVQVPNGYRAMPVKVDEDTVIKAISPGDRVDVMVFLRRNGQDIPETGAFTILKNVRVFAINTNTERAQDAKGESSSFKTVSLLVKPDHARELVVAAQMGKIMLTLRRPDEKRLRGRRGGHAPGGNPLGQVEAGQRKRCWFIEPHAKLPGHDQRILRRPARFCRRKQRHCGARRGRDRMANGCDGSGRPQAIRMDRPQAASHGDLARRGRHHGLPRDDFAHDVEPTVARPRGPGKPG